MPERYTSQRGEAWDLVDAGSWKGRRVRDGIPAAERASRAEVIALIEAIEQTEARRRSVDGARSVIIAGVGTAAVGGIVYATAPKGTRRKTVGGVAAAGGVVLFLIGAALEKRASAPRPQ